MDQEIISFTDELYKKCKSSTVNRVEEMLHSSNNEVYKYEDCLVNAVQGENFDVINYLIHNFPLGDYTWVCINAVETGNVALVIRFVRLGADVNDVISRTSRYEILKALLYPNVPVKYLIKSLKRSCKDGVIISVRMLLSLLDNISFDRYSEYCQKGQDILNAALKYNHLEIVDELLASGKIIFRYGRENLFAATRSGNLELVKLVLKSGRYKTWHINEAMDLADELRHVYLKHYLGEVYEQKSRREFIGIVGFIVIIFLICVTSSFC